MKKIPNVLAALLLASVQLLIPATTVSAKGPSCDATGVPISRPFSVDPTVLTGTAQQFDSSYSQGCGDAIVSYAWDFGDGATSTDANPSHTYTAAGSWTSTLTITDEAGLSASASTTATVRDSNAAPVANGDAYGFTTVKTAAVTDNDTDADGDSLNVRAVAQPQHGTLELYNSGWFTYTADSGYVGADTFTYVAYDDFGGESTPATVALDVQRVNTWPVVADDSAATAEDTTVTVDVLANDTDADGDALAVSVTSAENGTATVNADNTVTFTPKANFVSSTYNNARVYYQVDDGHGATAYGRAVIDVTPVNDSPVAVDDIATVREDVGGYVYISQNDTDVDVGDTRSYTVVSGPASGTLQSAGGSYYYKPNTNFNGTDSFTYRMTDAAGASSTATAAITVTPEYDAVQPKADTFSGIEDTQITGSVTANDVFEAGPLTAGLRYAPTKGTVVVNADGTFVYTPNANANGTDSFTYNVTDAAGTTRWQTVTLTVAAVNDNPVADFSHSVNRRTVTFTDSSKDVDGDNLTYSWSFGDGSTSTDANPTYTYARKGTYTVTLAVRDTSGATATATHSVSVY